MSQYLIWDASLGDYREVSEQVYNGVADEPIYTQADIDAAHARGIAEGLHQATEGRDRWEYGYYDRDEGEVVAYDGTPRLTTPRTLRRPLVAVGPWEPAEQPEGAEQ